MQPQVPAVTLDQPLRPAQLRLLVCACCSIELNQELVQTFLRRADDFLLAQPLPQQHGLQFRIEAEQRFDGQRVAIAHEITVLCCQQPVHYYGEIPCMIGRLIQPLHYPGPAIVEVGKKLVANEIAVESHLPV